MCLFKQAYKCWFGKYKKKPTLILVLSNNFAYLKVAKKILHNELTV